VDRTWTLSLSAAGTSRCDVTARAATGGTNPDDSSGELRRWTRQRTAPRAIPAKDGVQVRPRQLTAEINGLLPMAKSSGFSWEHSSHDRIWVSAYSARGTNRARDDGQSSALRTRWIMSTGLPPTILLPEMTSVCRKPNFRFSE